MKVFFVGLSTCGALKALHGFGNHIDEISLDQLKIIYKVEVLSLVKSFDAFLLISSTVFIYRMHIYLLVNNSIETLRLHTLSANHAGSVAEANNLRHRNRYHHCQPCYTAEIQHTILQSSLILLGFICNGERYLRVTSHLTYCPVYSIFDSHSGRLGNQLPSHFHPQRLDC